MNTYSDSAPIPPRPRTVVKQGAFTKVQRASPPRQHKGGGKRGKQCGHTRRSELRLLDFLSTCLPPAMVIWLTYPDVRGPGNVEKNLNSFLGRLERYLGRKLVTVTKMETQQRLSPELGILLWDIESAYLDGDIVERLWCKTIKTEARVAVESPRDWFKLATYISKQVVVTESEIIIGSMRYPSSEQCPEMGDSMLVKRAHNQEIQDRNDPLHPFPAPYHSSVSAEALRVRREWIDYKGRFYWKHHVKSIPRYEKTVMQVSEEQVAPLRELINANRKTHFLGVDDPVTLRGTDALKAATELGFAIDANVPAPKTLEQPPCSTHPTCGTHYSRNTANHAVFIQEKGFSSQPVESARQCMASWPFSLTNRHHDGIDRGAPVYDGKGDMAFRPPVSSLECLPVNTLPVCASGVDEGVRLLWPRVSAAGLLPDIGGVMASGWCTDGDGQQRASGTNNT